jgi:hypothetical protein
MRRISYSSQNIYVFFCYYVWPPPLHYFHTLNIYFKKSTYINHWV